MLEPSVYAWEQRKLGQLRKEYEERLPLYDSALKNAGQDLLAVKHKHRRRATLRIAYIEARVKDLSSIIRKASQRNVPVEGVWEKVGDIVGLRVVVNNLCDIEPLIAELEAHPAFAVLGREERAESGRYRAEHLQARYSFEHGGQRQEVACEIQVRTLLQDAWAVLTHHDVYRNLVSLPGLAQGIPAHLSNSLATLDDLADEFRAEM